MILLDTLPKGAGGEIGRHASFRSLWEKSLAGSSPALPTLPEIKKYA